MDPEGSGEGRQRQDSSCGSRCPYGETASTRTDIEVLWDSLPEPIDLFLVGGDLYWTDRGAEPKGNTLNRSAVPPKGELSADPEILARDFHEAIGLAVDVEAKTAYVTELGGRVRAVPLPGSSDSEYVVADLDGRLTGIVGYLT